MPLHAVVSFELRWQFINDSSLGRAPLEVLTILNFTPNHFRWPFPPNSNGLLSLSQAFRICMALLRTSKNYVIDSLQKEQRTRNERRNKQTWGKQEKHIQVSPKATYCILLSYDFQSDTKMFFCRKHTGRVWGFLRSFPLEASQWLHSRTAGISGVVFRGSAVSKGFAQRAKKARRRNTFCWFMIARQPTIPPWVVWLEKQNIVFCENISRARMNR